MGFQQLPSSIPMDKLFLNVKLEAIPILSNNIVDLTGSKTFTVGMMRENKGFGIIDIQIETKTSLQPIVDITFKDLYGNTVFDSSNKDTVLDYALLFDWPPPKFKFTFKGYLGKPVTWIMNLKKTNTKYNSSDGSYEIKVSFVPNQWGYLADIPFLYLLAKKRLKRNLQQISGSGTNSISQNKIESIFDIIKIGKTIDTKTKQVTKEFEKLEKQLSVLQENAIDGLINKDFEPADVIDGKVSGRQPIQGVTNVSGQNNLPNFSTITITLPPSLSQFNNDNIKFQETLKSLKGNPTQAGVEHRKIIALIGNPTNTNNIDMSQLGVINGDSTIFQKDVNSGSKIISDNLKLIDIETKRRLFETSEMQLGAVTISEVFSRLAADGGFILGSILDAGYTGYNLNKPIRDLNKLNSQPLIGKYFPLTLDGSNEQVPATAAGIETIGCEMSFVRNFIAAISEGIAENQVSENQDSLSNDDNKLIARINNLEIINSNPYKDASGQQFLENLLVRSGIAAYITRSFDPNQPGNYNTSIGSLYPDNDSADNIILLANKELKNITDVLLSSLSTEDYGDVKAFCRFINNLISPDDWNSFFINGINGSTIPMSKFPDITSIKNFPVYAKGTQVVVNGQQVDLLGTVDSMFSRFVNPTSIFYSGNTKGISDSINYDDFTAKYLYNNNTLWMNGFPSSLDAFNSTYVLFSNPSDMGAVDSAQNNDTDSQFNDIKSKESKQPLGIVKLSNGNDDKTKNPDEIKRLEIINTFIKNGAVYDYRKLQNLNSIPLISGGINDGYPSIAQLNNGKGIFYFPNTLELSEGKPVPETGINQDNIGNGVTFLVYSKTTSDNDPRLTWGLFDQGRNSIIGGDRRGLNQRIFLRTICVDIENRMNKIEDEQNNVLSQVLGKAQSSENALYIQMHHIFNQWAVLAFSLDNVSVDTNKSSDGSDKTKDQQIVAGTIAETLEKEYGTIIKTIEDGKITTHRNVEDLPSAGDSSGILTSSTGFIYDFPMERINPPPIPTNVGNSIINIEPLYKPNANTTLLAVITQLCTKNNFMFIPIPGNINYTNISDIFLPSSSMQASLGNVFHVLFTPTPENRIRENDGTLLSFNNFTPKGNFDAFEILFGSPNNSVVKNIDVSTDESRPTAESILNLQNLVDKNNSNKASTSDCSVLSIMEGRSYKMKVDMIGNAQISPMQYFFVPNKPIFSGLYQVMSVTHSITPNNMATTLEGVKMRFDGSSMKGIGPITIESLRALTTTTGTGSTVQPNVGTVSPAIYTGATLFGLPNPFNDSPNSSELDIIPGSYLDNNKKSITLAQINGKPVEINTAKAFLTMKKDAEKDGIKLYINSGFRPQYGNDLNTVSAKGVKVTATSQHNERIKLLQKSSYPDPNNVKNPQGVNVTIDSDTLKPQQFTQLSGNKTQGYFLNPVAVPGSSNHGNGVAIDLNTGTRKTNSEHTTQLQSDIYTWLIKNSWKYGFVRTVKLEEWHFEFNPTWAKDGPYGGFMNNFSITAYVGSIEGRDSTLFYTDLGLSNLNTATL
jgi:hypothetical protein